jgi:hypothetical protein
MTTVNFELNVKNVVTFLMQLATVGWQQPLVGNGKNEARSTTPLCISQMRKQFSL